MDEPMLNTTSWADQIEEGELHAIPEAKTIFEGNVKKVINYKRNDEGKLQKIVHTFKIERRRASKTVAQRKAWKKFGQAEDDGPGINPSTTTVTDDVFMTFITNKEDLNNEEEEDPLKKLKTAKMGMCRVCQGDHWTTKCPYKDTLETLRKELTEQGEGEGAAGPPTDDPDKQEAAKPTSTTGKYIPPAARDGRKSRGESMGSRRDDGATIRVTNLSEDTQDSDLDELFKPFGPIQRIFLAMDRNTGQSKGFAFITFHNKEDAEAAIKSLSGYGYDHLILKVEWAKPSGTR